MSTSANSNERELSVLTRTRVSVGKVPFWRWALYADGALSGIYTVLVGGTVLTGLVLWAGGGAFELGLLSALTTGGGMLVALTRRLQRRFGSHKRLTRLSWTLARAVWLPLVLVLASLAIGQSIALRSLVLPLLFVTVFLSAAFAGIGNVTWFGWCAELVPASQRGGFLAARAQWLSFASLVTFPAIGWLLDRSHARQADAAGFAAALVLNGLCAGFGWWLLGRVPTAIPAAPEAGPITKRQHHGSVSAPRLAMYTVVFQVAVYFSAPFMQAWALDRLGISLGTLLSLQVIAQIIPILTLGIWGKLVDRIGLRLPLGVCSLAKAVVPLCYIFSTPTAWWPLILTYVLSFLDAGITVSTNAAYASLAGRREGNAQVVHLNILTSIAASVTPLVVGYLIGHLLVGTVDVLGVMFVISAIGRGLSGIVLLVPEQPRRRRRRPPALTATTGVG